MVERSPTVAEDSAMSRGNGNMVGVMCIMANSMCDSLLAPTSRA